MEPQGGGCLQGLGLSPACCLPGDAPPLDSGPLVSMETLNTCVGVKRTEQGFHVHHGRETVPLQAWPERLLGGSTAGFDLGRELEHILSVAIRAPIVTA